MTKKEISSGAEKAETLAKESNSNVKNKVNNNKNTAKKPVKSSTQEKKPTVHKTKKHAVKKSVVKEKAAKAAKRAERKVKLEEKRLAATKLREERKQKRLEKKLEAKQRKLDRAAYLKEKRAERAEKRKERRDMLKKETRAQRYQRVKEEREAKIEARNAKRRAAVEERKAKREHRLRVRAEKQQNKRENKHAPGFGGWLAAVISLGVTSLALATMLTFGWISMNGFTADMAEVHTQSLYELNSIVDNLDTDLAKARVSNSANDQVRILNDIAIESQMAEVILERMPVDGQLTQNMTSFLGKMGDSAQSMLYSVANGKPLTDSQAATLEHMYNTNLQLKQILNELTSKANSKDIIKAMQGKADNLLFKSFDEIQHNNIETPKEIHDGPFAEQIDKVSAKNLENMEEISAAHAEELAKSYFNSYNLTGASCTGEAIANQLECYNLNLNTADGDMFVQISKKGGKVVMFDSYKDCNAKNFDVERCIAIASDFLESIGFNNMKAVWTSENGSTCNLNFAYEQDGVILYPDIVKVKVCEERGVVTGIEGLAYVLNHTERNIKPAAITMGEAQDKLHTAFEVEASRLTVIPFDGNETLAYEFFGTYGGNAYYVYIDATTGDEIEVFTVIGTAQGRALM